MSLQSPKIPTRSKKEKAIDTDLLTVNLRIEEVSSNVDDVSNKVDNLPSAPSTWYGTITFGVVPSMTTKYNSIFTDNPTVTRTSTGVFDIAFPTTDLDVNKTQIFLSPTQNGIAVAIIYGINSINVKFYDYTGAPNNGGGVNCEAKIEYWG